jgi:hypothetical protein
LTSAQLFIFDEETSLSQTICYVKIQREVIVYYIPLFIAYSRTDSILLQVHTSTSSQI